MSGSGGDAGGEGGVRAPGEGDCAPGGGGPVRVPGGGWALASGGPSAYHPYNCEPDACVHCLRAKVDGHDPDRCTSCLWDAGYADGIGPEVLDPPDSERDPVDPDDRTWDDHDVEDVPEDDRPASFDPVDERPIELPGEEDDR
jgi:hypothetical protein